MQIRGSAITCSVGAVDARTGARFMIERAAAAHAAGLDSLFIGDHHNVGGAPYYQNVPMLGRLLAEWDARPAGVRSSEADPKQTPEKVGEFGPAA